MVGIVILNWNGYEDTEECLDSLFESSYKDFHVYLIDNASHDGSQEKITAFIKQKKYLNKITLMLEEENHGFSKGSNIGIRKAIADNCEYIWLLNNDTVLENNTLELLVKELSLNDNVMIVTPKIVYESSPDIIWNCGGKISLLGFRKYYFSNKSISKCYSDNFSISFVTNCASMFRKEYFISYGLLSELFFFGEEDFEMCLRNKKAKIKMICVVDAILKHKVNRSISKISNNNIKKEFVHYLNRYIDMKLFYNNSFLFSLFRWVYNPYIIYLLLRKKNSLKEVIKFIFELNKQSKEKNNVNQNEFNHIMRIS